MFKRTLIVLIASLAVLSLQATAPRQAEAGMTDSLKALAGPLADQFGLPGSAVQTLFDKGFSLETATQLLFVSQSAKKSIGDVSNLYDNSNKSVNETADKLKVASSAYSPDKVQGAIDKAKADAQKQAVDEASKAAGSAVGGMLR